MKKMKSNKEMNLKHNKIFYVNFLVFLQAHVLKMVYFLHFSGRQSHSFLLGMVIVFAICNCLLGPGFFPLCFRAKQLCSPSVEITKWPCIFLELKEIFEQQFLIFWRFFFNHFSEPT